MTKMAEKPGLWGCTYLCSPYRGVPLPAGPFFTATFHDSGARHAMHNGLIREQGWLLVAKWRLLSKVSCTECAQVCRQMTSSRHYRLLAEKRKYCVMSLNFSAPVFVQPQREILSQKDLTK